MYLAQAFYRHVPGLILTLALSLSACASKAPVEAEKGSQTSAATKDTSAAKNPSSAEKVRPQRVEKGQKTKVEAAKKSPLKQAIANDALEVEASCGQCNFGLTEPKGCDLALRIDGKAYFVDGSHIDDHGDAHAERGMCNAIRRAAVVGEIVNARFVATHFQLID